MKAMWEARRRTIGCSSKPCSTVIVPASPGATCPSAPAIGKVHGRLGRWAKSGVCERIFKLLASDHDNEHMMIDASIVCAHQHSAGEENGEQRSVACAPS